jgi:hypothetical protein
MYLLITRRYCMYSNWYILCVICQLAARRVGLLPADIIHTKYTNCCTYSTSWWWANKCSKHVQTVNCNKLTANSASFWSCCTDVLWCTVNRTLKLKKQLPLSTLSSHFRYQLIIYVSSDPHKQATSYEQPVTSNQLRVPSYEHPVMSNQLRTKLRAPGYEQPVTSTQLPATCYEHSNFLPTYRNRIMINEKELPIPAPHVIQHTLKTNTKRVSKK